jgi:hypothetical protein
MKIVTIVLRMNLPSNAMTVDISTRGPYIKDVRPLAQCGQIGTGGGQNGSFADVLYVLPLFVHTAVTKKKEDQPRLLT